MIQHQHNLVGIMHPLCAQLLEPTLAEKTGLVDRSQLKAIRGRSRHEQILLAAQLGLHDYPNPAGGCLLTDPGFAHRLSELVEHGDPDLADIRLLRVGRHFRLDTQTKAVVGRDETENEKLEQQARPGDRLMDVPDLPGPTTLVHGDASEKNVRMAAALTAHYGKGRDLPSAPVVVRTHGSDETFTVDATPASNDEAVQLMITR